MPRIYYKWRQGDRSGRSTLDGIAKLAQRAPVTFWRPRAASAGVRVARVAVSQIGTVESPRNSNRGEQVQRYQAATTVAGTGWPWCVAFRRWCRDTAGVDRGGYRGAYVPHLELWARKAGKWRTRPSIGADVIFDWDGDGVGDHVGIVEKVSPFVTVEGNTQAGARGDQSNGGGVWRRTDRQHTTIRGYVAV
jgi:hypothetical protein